jgi:hypothetical protein
MIEGAPTEMLMLAVPDGPFAAAVCHADVTIAVSGRGVDPLSLRLEPIADPTSTFLGREPPGALG